MKRTLNLLSLILAFVPLKNLESQPFSLLLLEIISAIKPTKTFNLIMAHQILHYS